MKKLLLLSTFFVLLVMQTAWTQEPIALRGIAVDSKGIPLPDGNKTITYAIYDGPDSETPVWSEQQMVPIENGVFEVMLGDVNPIDVAFDDKQYWLGMRVGDDEELKPRLELSGGETFSLTPGGKRPADILRAAKREAGDMDGGGLVESHFTPAEPDKLAKSANPDIVHNDDVIIIGSICIGFDCTNGMSFGFKTLVLRENNVRMRFDDTSTSASFPNNDWCLEANDSSNGGSNHFAVVDETASRVPFKIEAGARTNALYVETDGDIGIGTNNPATDVHVQTGNTPTYRLAQDGSSGFSPQTWDVAGNEANFFIRDVTNGSTLPVRVRPSAPTSSIDIFSNKIQVGTSAQNIGIGTATPAVMLDVNGDEIKVGVGGTGDDLAKVTLNAGGGTASTALFEGQRDGLRVWGFSNAAVATADLLVDYKSNLIIRAIDDAFATTFQIATNGDVTGTYGNYHVASDMRRKKDIETITSALDKVKALRGVTFRWLDGSDDGTLQMGLVAQEVEEVVPEVVHTSGDAVQTKAIEYEFLVGLLVEGIKEQQQIIEKQKTQLAQISDEVAGIKSTLSQLHAILSLPVGATPSVDFTSDKTYRDVFKVRVDEYLNGPDENGRPKGSAQPIELEEN